MGRSRMALEVGTHSPWISRELAEMVRLTEGLSEATREVVASPANRTELALFR